MVRETSKAMACFVGLFAVFVASTGYMTPTLSGRMDSLERPMESLERRMDRIEAKIETLDEKFDKLLIALAGRGVVLPAKPDTTAER